MSDFFVAETNGKSFIVYNAQPLTDEPVTDEDMVYCEAHGEEMMRARSEAWSSGAWWYFVILDAGIILMSVDAHRGVLCKKKSYKFIEAYLNARVKF